MQRFILHVIVIEASSAAHCRVKTLYYLLQWHPVSTFELMKYEESFIKGLPSFQYVTLILKSSIFLHLHFRFIDAQFVTLTKEVDHLTAIFSVFMSKTSGCPDYVRYNWLVLTSLNQGLYFFTSKVLKLFSFTGQVSMHVASFLDE